MRVAVTGKPGTGKTTLCLKVHEALKDRVDIGGFITREVRRGGKRVGFRIVDLRTGEELWLARVGEGKFRVGRYAVFVENLEDCIEKSLNPECELLIIDEVGPMELKSGKFVDIVDKLTHRENMLVTVHYKSRHWLVEKIKRDFKLYVIDEKNRNYVAEEIIKSYDI